ncbi:MAG: site-2 protease family protein [Deltaproteobacteria bacterium]|nr:site-2 protease family protein [Deltaproteobacteria bacterium]
MFVFRFLKKIVFKVFGSRYAPLALLIITAITTVLSGAYFEGADPYNNPSDIVKGVPFSLSLLLILGSHEFAHYLAARREGVVSTLPYFIPGPPLPPLIGTFGAVIRLKSPMPTRRSLVWIGAAGPFAGLFVAVIVTAVGLALSRVTYVPESAAGHSLLLFDSSGYVLLGEPLIYKAIKYAVLGTLPHGQGVYVGSVAFAGWIGFFITCLNLIPVGQLDGGHILYASAGRAHGVISRALSIAFIIFGLLYFYSPLTSYTWPGWAFWGVIITAIGMRHPPVMDDTVMLDTRSWAASVGAVLALVLTFMPAPFYIV